MYEVFILIDKVPVMGSSLIEVSKWEGVRSDEFGGDRARCNVHV